MFVEYTYVDVFCKVGISFLKVKFVNQKIIG